MTAEASPSGWPAHRPAPLPWTIEFRRDRSIRAEGVRGLLREAWARCGLPEHIRSENGPEFVASPFCAGLPAGRGQSSFIKPEACWRNVSVDGASRRLKDELPAGALLPSPAEACWLRDRCRHDDNHHRKRRMLDDRTPVGASLQWKKQILRTSRNLHTGWSPHGGPGQQGGNVLRLESRASSLAFVPRGSGGARWVNPRRVNREREKS